MTNTQLTLIIGTIYLAPHLNKWYSVMTGLVFVIFSIFKVWGWL